MVLVITGTTLLKPVGGSRRPDQVEDHVIILGIVLLVLGLLLKISILTTIGIILAVVGGTGRAVGGRKHWY